MDFNPVEKNTIGNEKKGMYRNNLFYICGN